MVLPVRGYLEHIKEMMKGNVYIERGSRRRGVSRSPYCNNYKVSTHRRQSAVELFEKHSLSTPTLLDRLWTLSGCSLESHCRPEQVCHGDVIIRQFALRYPTTFDRHHSLSPVPKRTSLDMWPDYGSPPDSDDESTAEEDALPRGSGWVGRGSPMMVGSEYSIREYCDEQTLAYTRQIQGDRRGQECHQSPGPHRELLFFREPVLVVFWLESSTRLGTVRSSLPSHNVVGQLHVLQATYEMGYALQNSVLSVSMCETGRLFHAQCNGSFAIQNETEGFLGRMVGKGFRQIYTHCTCTYR